MMQKGWNFFLYLKKCIRLIVFKPLFFSLSCLDPFKAIFFNLSVNLRTEVTQLASSSIGEKKMLTVYLIFVVGMIGGYKW